MIQKNDVRSVDSFRSTLSSWWKSRRRSARGRWGVLAAAALTMGVALGYSNDASAAWGTCQPYIIYEVGVRNFQVTCAAGGDTIWMMYQAPDVDTAARFQAMMIAAILSTKFVRADLVTDAAGLCAGVGQTCRKATKWSVSTTATP